MVAADRHATALLHCAVSIQNIVGCPAAHIDHQCPEIFLMLSEDYLRRSEPAEHDILDVERQLFHAPDGVLNARAHTVDDMKIGFQFLPKHPDRIEHAVLSIDVIMLNDRMQESVLCRNAHLARVNFYILGVLLINLIAVFGQYHAPAIIETLKV